MVQLIGAPASPPPLWPRDLLAMAVAIAMAASDVPTTGTSG